MVENISKSVDDAACVIVILTPTFNRDESCLHLLNQVSSDRALVVLPVMLEECAVPESLGHLKVIQYYSWELLIQAIKGTCKDA